MERTLGFLCTSLKFSIEHPKIARSDRECIFPNQVLGFHAKFRMNSYRFHIFIDKFSYMFSYLLIPGSTPTELGAFTGTRWAWTHFFGNVCIIIGLSYYGHTWIYNIYNVYIYNVHMHRILHTNIITSITFTCMYKSIPTHTYIYLHMYIHMQTEWMYIYICSLYAVQI